jgi:hypothetical protein
MSKILYSLVVASVMLFAGTSLAQTANSVYIDQIGSNSNIDVTQQGSNNVVGTNTTKTILWGSNQNVTIGQIGSNNIAAVNVQGSNATLLSTVTGSLNTVNIGCGTGGSGNNGSCTDSNLTANATGDSNILTMSTGSKSTSSIAVTGDNNTASINTDTSPLIGNTASITALGDGNTLSIGQTGVAGANGHNGKINVTGSSNTIAVTQSGTIDTTVDVKSMGSSNNITVNTGN